MRLEIVLDEPDEEPTLEQIKKTKSWFLHTLANIVITKPAKRRNVYHTEIEK